MGGSSRPFARTLLVALASLVFTGAARAETQSAVDIVWRAPASCPSQRELESAVASTIGARATRREPIHADLDVWQSEAGGWKANLALSSAGQVTRRQVSGDTCQAVASAVAIVIGVAAIDDRVSAPDVASNPAPVETSPVAPASAGSSAPTPPSATPPPRPPRVGSAARPLGPLPTESVPSGRGRSRRPPLELGASAVLDIGSLPDATPGIELFLGVRPGYWRFEVVGTYLAEEPGRLPSAPGEGANLSQVDVGARACTAWGNGRLEAGPCIAARVAWMLASGVGPNPTSGTGNVVTGALGGRGTLRLTSWANVHLAAEALAPVNRPDFYISNVGGVARVENVFRPSAFGFRGFLGLDFHL